MDFINNLFFNQVFRIQMWLCITNSNFKSKSFDPTALIKHEGGRVECLLGGQKGAGKWGGTLAEKQVGDWEEDSRAGAHVWGLTT